jgi:glyoxylase-like metal-dependent hydrolase (beta-lactamase superfamily II)
MGLVVDAPLGSAKRLVSLAKSEGVQIAMVVNTHGHWEQIADNVALLEATGAPLYAHSWDATRMSNPALTMYNGEKYQISPSRADAVLHDGEVLEVGALRLEVMHTPGHSPGSVCLYEHAKGVLFSGDTLLRQGVGRTDAPGGNQGDLSKSLRRLAMLPDVTRVYPGHGQVTTIGDERWLLELAMLDAVTRSE